MANVLIDSNTMKSIANAIRSKTGKSALLLPSEMAAAIQSITTGGSSSAKVSVTTVTVSQSYTITSSFTVSHGLGQTPDLFILLPRFTPSFTGAALTGLIAGYNVSYATNMASRATLLIGQNGSNVVCKAASSASDGAVTFGSSSITVKGGAAIGGTNFMWPSMTAYSIAIKF